MGREPAVYACSPECILGFIKRSREVILPLCSALVRPPQRSCIQLWNPHYRKEMGLLKKVQRRATEKTRGLEHLSCGEGLRVLELFSLEMRRW